MLSGISITCFAASYAVAWLLECTRLAFRSGVRGAVMLGFAGAGVVAQTLYLGYRAVTTMGGAPLSSEFDWYLIAAWLLAIVYLYLTIYHPRTAFGIFVLPVVLALIGIAAQFADREPFARTHAAQVWGMIHGIFLLLGTVAVAVGFAGGVMGLTQAYRLKHKIGPKPGLRLPSLEWLERLNVRAMMVSVVMLGIGFLSGIVLNLVNDRLQVAHLPWSDPIVWSSALLLVWLVVAAGFAWLYKPARQGRKVAYLTLTSFAFLVLAVAVRVLLPSQHTAIGAKAAETPPAEQSVTDADVRSGRAGP
ncbi:MAG TPA: cytochrome c biogenesis protein CcsA [Pirellulales bacterium]|nr:cytochrome c biogenesis protein CcsA [Pirellulales bacterium]